MGTEVPAGSRGSVRWIEGQLQLQIMDLLSYELLMSFSVHPNIKSIFETGSGSCRYGVTVLKAHSLISSLFVTGTDPHSSDPASS